MRRSPRQAPRLVVLTLLGLVGCGGADSSDFESTRAPASSGGTTPDIAVAGNGGSPADAGGFAGDGGSSGIANGGGASGESLGGTNGEVTAGSAGEEAGGMGGAAGHLGLGGAGHGGAPSDPGPYSCLPLFEDVCRPDLNYQNDEADDEGAMFDQVIPNPLETIQEVACTVCSILYRDPDEIPEDRHPPVINLHIYSFDGAANALPGTGNINFSSRHIANYPDPQRALLEFRGVLVHETAHLYQHYGNVGLGEGMADFVRIRAGLYEPGRRRTGGDWTDPYTTSGFFFSWLAGPGVYHDDGRDPQQVDFGYLLNQRIGEQGPAGVPALFEEVFGETVDALWTEYQTAIQ